MSFQSAYSLELKQYVTPKEAFDFSCSPIGTPNHLTDAKMFQCGEKCSFKLTTRFIVSSSIKIMFISYVLIISYYI